MQLLRRVIFWCHLIAGVVGRRDRADHVGHRRAAHLRAADGRVGRHAGPTARRRRREPSRLAPAAIVAAVQAANPGAPLTAHDAVGRSRPPGVGRRRASARSTSTPTPGRSSASGSAQPRAFFRKMTDWHRWLGVTGEGRATARMITGACNLAFLFLVVSGFYLWLPRIWTWRQVRAVAWFRGGLRGKARDFNWHNAIGLWTAVPLFIVVLSGVVISYPWAEQPGLSRCGETPPARRAPESSPLRPSRDRSDRRSGGGAPMGLDPLWTRARAACGRLEEHHHADPARRRGSRLHDRSRYGGAASEAGDADAGCADRRRDQVGAVRCLERRSADAVVSALRAHGRSGWACRSDHRGARVVRRRRAGMDGALARRPSVMGVEAAACGVSQESADIILGADGSAGP